MQQAAKQSISWLFVIAWLGVIYTFSHQPDLHSNLPSLWDMIFRKIAHMAEFFVLAYLVYRSFRLHGVTISRSIWLACLLSISYAGFDEWHQSWVKGRVGSPVDVGIDSLGVLLFFMLQKYTK